MGLSFGPINSGLPKDIVKQIMEAEKIPLGNIEKRKGKVEEKSKLVGELGTLLEDLRKITQTNNTPNGFLELKVSTNNDIIDVVLDKEKAIPGRYQFQVDDLPQKSSAFSSGFADPNESYIGVGFIQYHLPSGETRDIYIDSDHATLEGVAKLINRDPELKMKAFVVNDGFGGETPWRLLLSVQDTGDENNAEFPYFYFVDGDQDFYLEYEREAHDGLVLLEGQEIEVNKHEVNDLVPGLGIKLKKASPGEEFTIDISEDITAINEKVVSLVEKFNAVISFIYTQNKLDQNSDTSRTLGGDITLQNIEMRLRNLIFQTYPTPAGPRRLGDLGIAFERSGLLKLDTNKLSNVVEKEFKLLANILLSTKDEDGRIVPGFIPRLNGILNGMLNMPSGLIPMRKQGFRSSIKMLDKQIEDKQRILDKRETMLKDKFARLEGTIAGLKSQEAGVASMAQGGQG